MTLHVAAALVPAASRLGLPASATFNGPGVGGSDVTPAATARLRAGDGAAPTGHIVPNLRKADHRFAGETGGMRAEVPPRAWQARRVGPDARVRLFREIDRRRGRTRSLRAKTLDVVE